MWKGDQIPRTDSVVEMTGFLKTFILFPADSFKRLTFPAISVGSKLRTQTTLSFPLTVYNMRIIFWLESFLSRNIISTRHRAKGGKETVRYKPRITGCLEGRGVTMTSTWGCSFANRIKSFLRYSLLQQKKRVW